MGRGKHKNKQTLTHNVHTGNNTMNHKDCLQRQKPHNAAHTQSKDLNKDGHV